MGIDVPLKKARRQESIPAVKNAAYIWREDWQIGGQGDSAIAMLHALARDYPKCKAKACPGNKVVKIKKGAILRVVKPNGTQIIFKLKVKPDRRAPSQLSDERIAKLRSELGATTMTVTACNPVTWWKKPHKYRHRVVATFSYEKTIKAAKRQTTARDQYDLVV